MGKTISDVLLFLRYFDVKHFLKSLLNLLWYWFCLIFWFFDPEACGILASQPGMEPTPPTLEGEVLPIGLPGKSLWFFFCSSGKQCWWGHIVDWIFELCWKSVTLLKVQSGLSPIQTPSTLNWWGQGFNSQNQWVYGFICRAYLISSHLITTRVNQRASSSHPQPSLEQNLSHYMW